MNDPQLLTSPYTPATIGPLRFRIPLYQRPYAWENTEIEQLLTDLLTACREHPTEPYYIGIMNVGRTDERLQYDLIDGQQRLTTLTLIGMVLSETDAQWKDFGQHLVLYGRQEDADFLRRQREEPQNTKLSEAVATIRNFVDRLGDGNPEPVSASAFSDYIYHHAAFFLAAVPDEYTLIDKNQHFVRMNNRGKQLEAHEIVKIRMANKLEGDERTRFVVGWNRFAQLGCSAQSEEGRGLEEPQTLRAILQAPETYSNRKGELKDTEILYESVCSYPEFLLVALARYGNQSHPAYDANKLESIFKGEDWTAERVRRFFEVLQQHYRLFVRYFIRRDREGDRYTFRNVDDYAQFGGREEQRQQLMRFQSYLYVSREDQAWMLHAFEWLAERDADGNGRVDAGEFLAELKRIDRAEYPLPADDEELDRILTYPKRELRYWLWRLDYYLWERREEYFERPESRRVAERYVFRRNRSVEHILPRHPRGEAAVQWAAGEEGLMNSFGNLAMISSGTNSLLSNAPLKEKIARVEVYIGNDVNGTIESLKLLKAYEIFHNERDWKGGKIRAHGEQM